MARSNAERITKALEFEALAVRFDRDGDSIWASRARRSARLLRKITARKCREMFA